jgi:hypothetical protein
MRSYLFLIFLSIGVSLRGQDIDRMLRAKPFSHSGSVALNTMCRFDQNSSNPFTYVLSANYTPVFFGISVPLSVMYSNQNFAYGLPYNQWRFAPSYRWIRAQFGDVGMQFSPYSFAGHRLRGVGVEVQPNEHWAVSTFHGRLSDYRAADSSGHNGSLERMGYGAKVAYSSASYSLNGSFFKAKDFDVEAAHLAPQENVVVALAGQWTLAQNLRISGEIASSALTGNTRDELVNSNFRGRELIGFCLPYRLSTAVFHAYKINIGAPFLSVAYEYVAPNYQTLGAYYSTNDFENFTLNMSHKFRNFAFGGRFGVQRDDLKNEKGNRSQRLVYAGNLSYSGKSRFFGQFNYSTFQTFTRVEKFLTEFETTDPYVRIDTLNLRQVSQHGDVNFGFRFAETAASQQQIQASFSLQKASENGLFWSSSLNYIWNQKGGMNFGASAFCHQEAFGGEGRPSLGLTAFLGNSFAERKVSWRLTVSENFNSTGKNQFILKTSASYTLYKQHRFQGQFSQRLGSSGFAAMINIGYGYSFGR